MAAGEAAREVAAPRLTAVFNIQGSEMIFLLLVALVILGPEKLPEAVRKFAKTYAEFKKMANGFQGEFRQALDEPMREFRETANAVRDAAKFDIDGITSPSATPEPASTPGSTAVSEIAPRTTPPIVREPGLNFGSANPRRQARIARSDESPAAPGTDAAVVDDPPAAPGTDAAVVDDPPAASPAQGDASE